MTLKLHALRLLERLPWTIAGPILGRMHAPVNYWCLLLEDPLILLIPEDTYDDETHWRPFFDALKGTKTYFICQIRGAVERDPAAFKRTLREFVATHAVRYPKHEFTFMANNTVQTRLLEEASLRSIYVNQNALANESVLTVHPEVQRKFDAIHNAQIAAVKRHDLAREIDRLAIITYIPASTSDAYFNQVATVLKHATWLNFPDGRPDRGKYQRIQPDRLALSLCAAHTGLCLSEMEGAMFASIEYLLCGLPVITTPSIGGRDVFFSDDYVVTVDPTPQAVRQGVEDLIARKLEPDYIRNETLKLMAEHRRRFVDHIVSTAASAGVELDAATVMNRLFPGDFYKLRPFHHVLAYR